jgi:hypothetical protein
MASLESYGKSRVINKAYYENSCNFKNTLLALNIEGSKYQNFMSLMYKYPLTPKNKPPS